MRPGRSAFQLLVVAAALAGSAHAADGQWREGSVSGSAGVRSYRLFVPSTLPEGRRPPLVVMLHGCTQTPEAFAQSTRMNEHAARRGFLVLYPEQKVSDNPARCWNWFLPKNQARDAGEPALIAAMVDKVAGETNADRRRVWVAGLSAGGSMAAILASCYPDVFAAAAVHDGTMFKAATSLVQASSAMRTGRTRAAPERLAAEAWACSGRKPLPVPVAVWHGTGDNVVDAKHGPLLVRQFRKLNDLADDGRDNDSVPARPASTVAGQVPGGYAYRLASYGKPQAPLVQYYEVEKLGHAWSGGKADLLFSDSRGPDASALILDFFEGHAR